MDRSQPPAPGPAPLIQLGESQSFVLENGLKVFVVENHKLPRVAFSLVLDLDPIFEGENAGYISAAGQLMSRGTYSRTKAQIDEEGLVGDAHAGAWHRQVSLLAYEDMAILGKELGRDMQPGEFGENLTLQGLDLGQAAVLDRIMVGAVVTVVSLFFTRLEIQHPLITISVLLLTSIVFAMAGMVNAIFANKFDDIAIVPTFILTPLTYLGGVFYSISLLPEFWQRVSAFNPILYMVNGFRYGILGVSDVSIAYAYAIIAVFGLVLGSLCLWLLHKGIGLRS